MLQSMEEYKIIYFRNFEDGNRPIFADLTVNVWRPDLKKSGVATCYFKGYLLWSVRVCLKSIGQTVKFIGWTSSFALPLYSCHTTQTNWSSCKLMCYFVAKMCQDVPRCAKMCQESRECGKSRENCTWCCLTMGDSNRFNGYIVLYEPPQKPRQY